MSALPVAVLDRANAREDEAPEQTLAHVIDRARHVERLGYRRFWVAEHHGVPGILGSTPTLLMAAVAARTSRIRVGSGGVMLPAHQPLVVAEQVATLELLHPGRIDLGLGRSLGFTPAVRTALRHDASAAERFGDDITELQSYLDGTAPITAQPQNHGRTPLFVLANRQGLEFAARAGLAVVLGGPGVRPDGSAVEHPGIARYRKDFRPSPWFDAPYVIVATNIAVADTTAAARDLLVPEAWALVASRRTGAFPPLISSEQVAMINKSEQDVRRLTEHLAGGIHGTPDEVRRAVTDMINFTGADELLVTGDTYDHAAQLHSDALLIKALNT
ncbi:MsnO8 family LLM class oxidoreductase [Microlunatus sp. Y2014]|uniref:MsnO8 family LLM class oxidoreductase n=1 Tax=Microlunatus sp. Y2014 TaxID=3418488 RepID=UPI003DA75944